MINETNNSKNLRERISRFDGISDSYDMYRPGYPDILFDDLVQLSKITLDSKILEIGSGSGKATIALAQKKHSIVCIDPNQSLIQIAKSKLGLYDVTFYTTTFEDWIGEQNFDLIISAQAFHWIRQEVSYKKTYAVLQNNGYLALIWNMYLDAPNDFRSALQTIYQQYHPSLYIFNYSKKLINARFHEIANSGYFQDTIIREYPWEVAYTKDQFIGFLGTFGVYSRLDPSVRSDLFAKIGELIDDMGGKMNIQLMSILYLSQRH